MIRVASDGLSCASWAAAKLAPYDAVHLPQLFLLSSTSTLALCGLELMQQVRDDCVLLSPCVLVWIGRHGYDERIVYCVLCTVYCVLHCVLRTVYCVLCTVYCVLCTVYCVLCTVYCVQ